MGMGQAESDVSQEAADQAAMARARTNAIALLTPQICPVCQLQIIATNIVDGGDVDYSEYFQTGLFLQTPNQPWRLIDAITDALIATGHVEETGTLVVDNADYGYAHGTFDALTFTYSDNPAYPGPTTLNLQLGCNVGGQISWPDPQGYGGV